MLSGIDCVVVTPVVLLSGIATFGVETYVLT
jgi:hypothetical protein